MILELIQDEYEPCTPKIFKIDGINANPDDFGEVSKLTGDFCCKYTEIFVVNTENLKVLKNHLQLYWKSTT